MSWGNKILIVIIVFIVGMLSMVYVASRQTNEMFEGDYYEKELKFQNFIDASKNLQALPTKLTINQTTDSLNFILPQQASASIDSGYIELLKADDSKKDIKQNIVASTSSMQTILKIKATKGVYTARVFWTNNKTPYYFEQKINVIK